MNFDHNLIINQLLFYEVYQLFVAPRAKDQSNFDLVFTTTAKTWLGELQLP